MAILSACSLLISYSVWAFEPLLFGAVVNTVQHYTGSDAINKVIQIVFIWIGIYVVYNMTNRIGGHLANRVGYYLRAQYVARNYRKLCRLPLKWHADHHSGETVRRIDRAADTLDEMAGMQWRYFYIFSNVAGSFAGLLYLSWKVALIAIAVFATFYAAMAFLDHKLQIKLEEINERQNRILAAIFDFAANMRSIITLRLGSRTARVVDAKVETARWPTIYAWGVLAQIKWTVISFAFMFLQIGVVLYFVLTGLYSGEVINLGTLAAMYIYLDRIGAANYDLTDLYNSMMKDKAALLNARRVEGAKDAPASPIAPSKWKKFEAKGIRFAHDDSRGKDIICGADFCFSKGDKIALMGESGSGKSTLLVLLRGLKAATCCEAFIDGKKVSGGVGVFASNATFMLQDPEVFENTIRYNITMGLPYSAAEIKKALRLSRFDQVLKKLPSGLETDIREKGVNLSGGERQRLALARNILAAQDSEIVLMDEITSSIDVENETFIYDAILKEFKNKTVIAAVHKPAMAKKFDRIIRIEAGKAYDKK